jgi:hypothetical protein
MSSEVWLPILTGFVGVFVGYLLELDRDRRAYKHDRVTRRRESQRIALLQIQDLVGELVAASQGGAKLREKELDEERPLTEREMDLLQLYEERAHRAQYALGAQSSRVESELLTRCVNTLIVDSTKLQKSAELKEEQRKELRESMFTLAVATVGTAHELLPDLY